MEIHDPEIIGNADANELNLKNGVSVDEISNDPATNNSNSLLTSAAIHTVAKPYVKVIDQKATGTDGGTFTSGSYQTRDLNTIKKDTDSIASLSSNILTLPAGTYYCSISCPVSDCGHHQTFLWNDSDNTIILKGTTEYSRHGDRVQNRSFINGRFTLAATKNIKVQHYCTTTETTNGFGRAASIDVEVYTVAEFWKLS